MIQLHPINACVCMDAEHYCGIINEKTTVNELIAWILSEFPDDHGSIEIFYASGHAFEHLTYRDGESAEFDDDLISDIRSKPVSAFKATRYGRSGDLNFDITIG